MPNFPSAWLHKRKEYIELANTKRKKVASRLKHPTWQRMKIMVYHSKISPFIKVRKVKTKLKRDNFMKKQSILSLEELDALVRDWGGKPKVIVDKYFPIRFWILTIVATFFTYNLLFNFDLVAHNMAIDRIEVDRLDKFLYFRGWDVFFEFCIFLYTYIKEKYFGIVSLIIIISMLTDFISDLFNIYFSVIGHPSPLLTIIITIRLLAIYCAILNLKYSQNLPNKNDKFNILLSFKSV